MTYTDNEYNLGKLAYNAYCKSTNWKSAVSGDQLPMFFNCPATVQTGWIEAAKALKVHLEKEVNKL